MKISYLVTFSSETDTLKNLLERLAQHQQDDEIVLLADSGNLDEISQEILMTCFRHAKNPENRFYYEHNLNNNYSEHKNWGMKQCSGDFIFQIDGDECPTEILLENIKDILKSNPEIEAFWIPRINDFIGITEKHAKQWGWRLTMSPTYKRFLVNWPDPQCRLFLNKPEIKWVGRLHERIEGNKNFVYLPFDEELALYHDKTIEKQIETNLKYNKLFTEKENQGFVLPTK